MSITTGPDVRTYDVPTYDCRVAFADELLRLAREDDRIVAVCNDSVGSSNLVEFGREFPDRLINVGIAEQDMVGVGAGLALSGYVPFVCGAAPFLTARALEQIKADVAYSRAPVVLCGMSPGMAYGELGPTHHSIEDLSWLRAIAGLGIVVPAGPVETRAAVRWAAGAATPVFLRVGRFKVPEVTAGGAIRLAARETGAIVTVEDATTTGGLGAAVAAVVVTEPVPARMRMLGVPRQFAPTGSTAFLLDHFGLAPADIRAAAVGLARAHG